MSAGPAQLDRPLAHQSRWQQRLWKLVRLFLVAYLFVTLLISMLQELLIFPGHASQGQKSTIVRPSRSSELVTVQSSRGDRIVMLLGKASNPDGSADPDSASRPSLIYFYGNAMSLSDTTDICREWRRLGANVLAVEYPGYGMSSGKPGEEAFYSAAEAAYDYLASHPDIDKRKIIALGQSLGTGVAVELALRRNVAGVVLLSGYTSMDDMARLVAPILPTGLIVRHHFRSEQKISQLRCPILIVHGTGDNVVPVEMSHRLAAAAKNAQVTELYVKSDHNDLLDEAGPQIDQALGKLIAQVDGLHSAN